MKELISDYLKMKDVEFLKDYSLSRLSTVRIGGIADVVAFPKNIGELCSALDFCLKNEIFCKTVGRMSNVLFGDGALHGMIVRTDRMRGINAVNGKVRAECGATLSSICRFCEKIGLSGFEELSGIPSSLGGAISGNAGAFGREICELISDVTVLDTTDMCVHCLSASELAFSYRTSCFKRDSRLVILSAKLDLTEAYADKVRARRLEVSQKRAENQPTNMPSLGSTFKKCDGVGAGAIIDSLGLKGVSVGGAEVSRKHAGFIVNRGGATARDYITLMRQIALHAYRSYSVLLEPEIETVNCTEV